MATLRKHKSMVPAPRSAMGFVVLVAWAAVVPMAHADLAADERLVADYVRAHGNQTFRSPAGRIKYPYMVPGGFYQQVGAAVAMALWRSSARLALCVRACVRVLRLAATVKHTRSRHCC